MKKLSGAIALHIVSGMAELAIKNSLGGSKETVSIKAALDHLAPEHHLRGFVLAAWGEAHPIGGVFTADNYMDVALRSGFSIPA